MLANLKLGTKFSLILIGVFILGVVIGGLVLWQVLQRNAEKQVSEQGLIVIENMSAVRRYTSNQITPLLESGQEAFVPEAVPAYSARRVFEQFRQEPQFSTFWYKEASLNPTNPDDQADDFERRLIVEMQAEPDRPEIFGFRRIGPENMFFIARPMIVRDESCLMCHSTPEAAPADLVEIYGAENGFGWQMDSLVAAQMIYVPAVEVFKTAERSFMLVMGIYILVFALAIISISLLLRRYVIRPVVVVGRVAQKISADEATAADIETEALSQVTTRNDELGYLAQVFQGMAREVYARTQKLKAQVQSLRIELDEAKRKQQVEEVVETDFFRDLQAKASEARQRRRERRSRPGDE